MVVEVFFIPNLKHTVDALDIKGVDGHSVCQAPVDLCNRLLLAKRMCKIVIKLAIRRRIRIVDDPDGPGF